MNPTIVKWGAPLQQSALPTLLADPQELLPAGSLFNDRSVRQAAVIAGVWGLIGMALLSFLFLEGDFLAGMANHHGMIGLSLSLVLLATVGGYGMLAFYGFRLRIGWAKRNEPASPNRRHDPGRLALSDLRKIRLYSGLTMLAILVVYLTPNESPMFRGLHSAAHWWQRPFAAECIMMVWTTGAALVVFAARRAAWDIAAAAGDLSGPEDVRAFEVLGPGANTPRRPMAEPTPVHRPPADVAATPILLANSTASIAAQEKETVAPLAAIPMEPASFADVAPSLTAAVFAKSDIVRITASESVNNRRDWEAILLGTMVMLLLMAIHLVDAGRPLRPTFTNLDVVFDTYEAFKTDLDPRQSNNSFGPGPATLPKPAPLQGAGAVLAVVSEQLASVLGVACILWVTFGLMAGPRWRRAAVVLLAVFVVTIAYAAIAKSYYSELSRIAQVQNLLPTYFGYLGLPIKGSVAGMFWYAIIPALLVLLLTRPSTRMLVDQRVQNRRKIKRTR